MTIPTPPRGNGRHWHDDGQVTDPRRGRYATIRPMTAEPPSTSTAAGPPASHRPAVQVREGGLAAVARIVAILRDLLIIALVVGLLSLGGKIVTSIRGGVQPGEAVTPASAPCAAPTTDEYGTYCPEQTPGD